MTALGWLASLPAELDRTPVRVRLGQDVRFWATAARMTLELLARQRFLPGVDGSNSRARALWEPLLDEEHERVEVLASDDASGLPRLLSSQ